MQYLCELGATVDVVRNDAITADALLAGGAGTSGAHVDAPAGLVISPGPGEPQDAGISIEAVRACAASGTPLLGVCLGHQSIGVAFGGRIARARSIMHGKVSSISHDGRGVFAGLASPLEATRYHSLVIDGESVPAVLEVTARTDDGEIMGLRHRELPIEGVQFHPESIMTTEGKRLLRNFLGRCGGKAAA